MPQLAWTVAGILVVQVLLELLLNQFIPAHSLLGRNIASVVYYALLTPYFVAVHRFIILGEVTKHYRLPWRDIRFQLFFGWAFTVFALCQLPWLTYAFPRHWMLQLIGFAAAIGVCVVFTRLTILFPAIAVDAPGATPRNAFDDTKGHGWYIFFLFLVSFLPSVLAVGLLAVVTVLMPALLRGVVLLAVVGVAIIVWVTLAVVVASRLYQAYGNRLNQPA